MDLQNVVTKSQGGNLKSKVEEAFPDLKKEIVTFANGLALEKIDSIYILQGDMILTQEQVDIMNNNILSRSATITSPVNYWNENVVYYTFDPSFTYQSNVFYAMREWEAKTCIRFLPKDYRSSSYVEFFHGDGAYSSMGKVGGKQQISLGYGSSIGNAIHEIGHAIGLFHEHMRADRDNYVTINWNNIIPGKEHNFRKYTDLGIPGIDIGTFDFNSIMLYSSDDFSKNVYPTMVNKNGEKFVGQRMWLSEGDLDGVKYMYGPPFVRLERYEDFPVWDNTEEWMRMDNYLVFYTDQTFTTTAELPYPRNVRVQVNTAEWYSGRIYDSTTYFDVTVPAGIAGIYLSTTDSRCTYDYGNIVRLHQVEYFYPFMARFNISDLKVNKSFDMKKLSSFKKVNVMNNVVNVD